MRQEDHKANGGSLPREGGLPGVSSEGQGEPLGPERLLTAPQVADVLQLSTQWVWEHATGRKRPKLPCVRLGSMLRFRREDLAQFIRENCQ